MAPFAFGHRIAETHRDIAAQIFRLSELGAVLVFPREMLIVKDNYAKLRMPMFAEPIEQI
jgi:hypothetical protein